MSSPQILTTSPSFDSEGGRIRTETRRETIDKGALRGENRHQKSINSSDLPRISTDTHQSNLQSNRGGCYGLKASLLKENDEEMQKISTY